MQTHVTHWMSPRLYRLNGLLAMMSVLLALSELAGVISISGILYPNSNSLLISNIIFLNTVHIAFTYLLIKASPEFGFRWRVAITKIPWLPVVAVLSAVFIASIIFSLHFKSSYGKIIFDCYNLTVPLFHVMAQYMGLCFDVNPRSRTRMRALWGLVILSMITHRFVSLALGELPLVANLMASIPTVVLFLLSLHPLRSVNLLFHVKLLLFPLTFFSRFALFALACLHGIEYASVVFSRPDLRPANKVVASTLGLVILVITLTWFSDLYSTLTPFTAACNSVLIAAVILHYWADSVLFRSPKFYGICQ